jgi:hypothetical protein
MSDGMQKYAQQLRWLVDDYYHRQITLDDYRAQRKVIFDRIEVEFASDNKGNEAARIAAPDESTVHS